MILDMVKWKETTDLHIFRNWRNILYVLDCILHYVTEFKYFFLYCVKLTNIKKGFETKKKTL